MSVAAAFIEGQGADLTSAGILQMAAAARKAGYRANVYPYQSIDAAKDWLLYWSRVGNKTAVVGYSLGAGTATALSAYHVPLDLLICLDPSELGYNYKLDKTHTKRSILWHDSNWLNGPIGHAGYGLGFDLTYETMDFHLGVDLDPKIQANVAIELARLASEK